MESSSGSSLRQPPVTKKKQKTAINALNQDILSMIFAFLDLVQLIRCSAVCKSWSTVIDKLKLLKIQYNRQQQADSLSPAESSSSSRRPINIYLEQFAFEWHRSSLQRGPVNVFQWKGHSFGINQCRMKMGLILTGVGDKVMRLWSVESYRCLDEYSLPDRAALIDFDFDEGKVVGLAGTRICIWTRSGTRNVFSSRDGMFTKGLCMRYVDPEAVVGCEDGKIRVFDMYSRKCSQIIKMHHGPITCLSFSEDQLLISGSSSGSISLSDLASDQQVTTLKSTGSAGIKTLCLNSRSHILFAGSTDGHASCWDLRTLRRLWERRVSPNVLYSMNHLKNDTSTLVVGGLDGVLRALDQDTGEVLSMYIMDEPSSSSNNSKDRHNVIEKKKVRRLAEDERIDALPVASRPSITCLAVGMQKVVTTHAEKYIRVWRFSNS
ncbi:hypothetical protein M9H77_02640 [Catharanthus roseus]|uniref:Uncharacterized protein n=1 Tax=Catharanthus roseus TaxID=4058 RepID=A0ACC0C8Y8_CATRO|nr:hypothetical protein M9H77_02640 [Catharanthus roseus]